LTLGERPTGPTPCLCYSCSWVDPA